MRRTAPALSLLAITAGCAVFAGPAAPSPDPIATAFAGADTLRVDTLQRGVHHIYAWEASGPWGIHVIASEPGRCAPRPVAIKAGPPLAARGATHTLAGEAVAAVNGDFFAIPAGTPLGAHVRDGEVLIGPSRWPVIAFDDRGPWIGRARLDGIVTRGRDTLVVTQVNRPDSAAASLHTTWLGGPVRGDSTAMLLRLRRISGGTASGVGVIDDHAVPGDSVVPDSSTWVIAAPSALAPQLNGWSVGDTVRWRIRIASMEAPEREAREALAGRPVLIAGGAETNAGPELGISASFRDTRHPRTAVGITRTGRILLVVVDGRQAPYSVGMSLPELTALMKRLGAVEAMNLDGGGSSAIVSRGRVLNRPSDAAGERAVANVLALMPGNCRR